MQSSPRNEFGLQQVDPPEIKGAPALGSEACASPLRLAPGGWTPMTPASPAPAGLRVLRQCRVAFHGVSQTRDQDVGSCLTEQVTRQL